MMQIDLPLVIRAFEALDKIDAEVDDEAKDFVAKLIDSLTFSLSSNKEPNDELKQISQETLSLCLNKFKTSNARVWELKCRLIFWLIRSDLIDNKILSLKLFKKLKLEQISIDFMMAIPVSSSIKASEAASLALEFVQSGLYEKAIELYSIATKKNPTDEKVWYNFGNLYNKIAKYSDAVACYEKSIRLNQKQSVAWYNLGNSFRKLLDFEKAVKSYKYSLHLNPNQPDAFNNLGVTFLVSGKPDKSIEYFKSSVLVENENPRNWSGLAMASQYSDNLSKEEIFEVHKEYGMRATSKITNTFQNRNDKIPNNKICVGLVSGDFRVHSVTKFLSPIFLYKNQHNVRIICFSNNNIVDEVTNWFKKNSDKFYSVENRSTDELQDLIIKEKVDVLIDLSGHSNLNRLDVFAQRSAPVQVSWLGYPGTTGLPSMDYKIVSENTDQAQDQNFYTEKLIFLNPMLFCYAPISDLVGDIPTLERPTQGDHIVFGSFNASAKYSKSILQTWCKLLQKDTDSSLLLKSGCFFNLDIREEFHKLFEDHSISRDRIDLRAYTEDVDDHLKLYNQIDVALDVSPFSGATTTCESLLMGKPIVTLKGDTHAGRVTSAILTTLDYGSWIADNEEDYIKKCLAVANKVRANKHDPQATRELFLSSKLCDKKYFAEQFFKLIGAVHGRK